MTLLSVSVQGHLPESMKNMYNFYTLISLIHMAFTDVQILRAKASPTLINDEQGLSLLLNPDGSKGWGFRYRFADKARLNNL